MHVKQLEIVSILLLGAAATAGAAPAPPLPAKTVKDVSALEQKLLGKWEGQGGCDGEIVFKSDGTFERSHYGPGGSTLKGTWKVRWDALPPTLVLTCKTSDVVDWVGQTTEVKITQLDDSTFSYKLRSEDAAACYKRVKK